MKIDDVTIGMEINNDTLCEIFGCSPQGGMRYSKRTNTLVLISNRVTSIYTDDWDGDILLYTGMGQKGDQSLTFAQNKTLAESNSNGVTVHLFEVHRGEAGESPLSVRAGGRARGKAQSLYFPPETYCLTDNQDYRKKDASGRPFDVGERSVGHWQKARRRLPTGFRARGGPPDTGGHGNNALRPAVLRTVTTATRPRRPPPDSAPAWPAPPKAGRRAGARAGCRPPGSGGRR